MIVDGSFHKTGFPISFVPTLIKPIKDKHIMSPFELKMKALFKKMKALNKEKKKGGGKSKYNIKMARKFRRTRRKRGSGPGGDAPVETEQEYKDRKKRECNQIKTDLSQELTIEEQEKLKPDFEWCKNWMKNNGYPYAGGRRSRRKRRRRTKKRKSRRRKKRSRRRRRKKR